MSAQLTLTEDLHPARRIRPRMHEVRPGPRVVEMADTLSLLWDEVARRPKNLYELPWPEPAEDRVRVFRPHTTHGCGLFGGHRYDCLGAKRCSLPDKSPCADCQRRVQLSYKAGRYVSR